MQLNMSFCYLLEGDSSPDSPVVAFETFHMNISSCLTELQVYNGMNVGSAKTPLHEREVGS